MAITNHERVGKALELLTSGLQPFVERELKTTEAPNWFAETKKTLADSRLQLLGTPDKPQWDAAAILVTMWNEWNNVFRKTLGHAERTLVSELREVRNQWAHQRPFSTDDAYRALDSAARLLTAVSAQQADEVEKMKMELLRVRFDEQVRTEKRKAAGTTIETQAQAGLKPWREVVNPHQDVASGKYQQAEFAADLWQVHLGEGSDEYKKPVEFFRRTYLTESLKGLLSGAAQRLSGTGGDPVVQLQTNFGGGKTHSMLALFHLFSGTAPGELLGVDAVLQHAGVTQLPKIKRVVLVGNKLSPGNPVTKPDGTVVRTLWGELAWQLGGKKAYTKIKADDEHATSPGDALRRLSTAATFLYQDSARYWYSTQPTVTKLADDRAEQLKTDPDAVAEEVGTWLRNDLRKTGDFSRVHSLPRMSGDVPDDKDARLVVFGIEYPHTKDTVSPAVAAAQEFLQNRGTAPRIYQNTLVFLAADKTRFQDLDEAVRRYLAWSSIVDEAETLNLDPHQSKQALAQKENASSAVAARLPEAYQWLIVPTQATPQANVEWQAFRLTGQDALAIRASKKLRNDELLISGLAASRLRLELDQVPLWRGDHVQIQQLTEDFARYLYLPRVKDTGVLTEAVRSGLGLLTWAQDSFAYAESFDETVGRYRGLQAGRQVWITEDSPIGLLVKPEPAQRQLAAETSQPGDTSLLSGGTGGATLPVASGNGDGTPPPALAAAPKRFHGTATLDSNRVGRDAGRIADEVVAHLAGIVGSQVKVTLEIEAEIPSGAPEHVVRTVTENCRTLKFDSHGFEKE